MKRMILLVIIVLTLLPAAGAIIEEDWGNYTRADTRDDYGNNVTLNRLNESFTNSNENYTVTLKDFDAEGNVLLDFNFKGKFETINLRNDWNRMISKESLELFDGIMIITPFRISSTSGNFSCCTEVEINIKILRPTLKIELNKDSKSYSYRYVEEIPLQIDITNEGDGETISTEVYVDTDGLIFKDGKTYYDLPSLFGTEQKSIKGITNETLYLTLKFPDPSTKLNYKVHVYVKGIKGDLNYFNDASKTISLLPSISFTKYVTENTVLLTEKEIEDLYIAQDIKNKSQGSTGGNIYVKIALTNYQNDEIKGINLSDAYNEQLKGENISLNWTFNLKPHESKEFNYKLNALRPGRFTHPKAVLAYFDLNMSWRLFSKSETTQVSGPCIEVIKKPVKSVMEKGENTSINVTVRNSGDMASRVKVNDTLPINTTFIGGKMVYEGYLYATRSASFSYNISMNETGQLILPEPMIKVNGNDYIGCEPISTEIPVQDSTPPPTIPPPTETIVLSAETQVQTSISLLEKYGWFEGVFPAFMLVLTMAIFIILHRSSK